MQRKYSKLLINKKKFLEKRTCDLEKQSAGGVPEKNLRKTLAKLTRKYLCQSPIFNKAAGCSPGTVARVNFAKFSTTVFLQNTGGRLDY